MSAPKDTEIKVRLPRAMKEAVKAIADKRFTSESEIAREAIIEYLKARGVAIGGSESATTVGAQRYARPREPVSKPHK